MQTKCDAGIAKYCIVLWSISLHKIHANSTFRNNFKFTVLGLPFHWESWKSVRESQLARKGGLRTHNALRKLCVHRLLMAANKDFFMCSAGMDPLLRLYWLWWFVGWVFFFFVLTCQTASTTAACWQKWRGKKCSCAEHIDQYTAISPWLLNQSFC